MVHASVVVAALVDVGESGTREEDMLPSDHLAAHLMPAEVSNVLRRLERAGDAWYVALAEDLDATLATLDQRLVGASTPNCRISVPSG